MNKENTAVFIGHNECYGVTSEQIKEAIVSLIDKGVTEFLSGGQSIFITSLVRLVVFALE